MRSPQYLVGKEVNAAPLAVAYWSAIKPVARGSTRKGVRESVHRERDKEIRRRRKRRQKALKRRIKELKSQAKKT
jgi:hypothetical protein